MNEIKFEVGGEYFSFYTVGMRIVSAVFTVVEINGENIIFQRESGKKIKTKIKRKDFYGGYLEYAEVNKYVVSAKKMKK